MDWGYVTGYFDGEGNVCIIRPPGRNYNKASISFANTNLESLKAIRDFIGCGRIRPKGKPKNRKHKQGYSLYVEVKEDVIRVATAMLDHSIVKRCALLKAIAAASVRIAPTGKRGALAAIGPDEVRRLYESGMSINALADQVGVTYSAVRRYMKRNGIARRKFDDPITQRRVWTDESKKKAAESRRRLWLDPEYRSKAAASMKRAA